MIDDILKAADTDFDFRRYAHPADPLAGYFEQWVPYYRLKYAIAKTLQPESILEIGVRFGYSAMAFLEAAPKARYLGIDADVSTFGGEHGAVNWAQRMASDLDAEFLIADSQEMDPFPSGPWDLVHIDSQQDGDGTFAGLEKAARVGRRILVDGYFWSRENMLATTLFLEKYRRFITSALIIPGYAGEMLITICDTLHMQSRAKTDLCAAYDTDYYLEDCGGYDAFLQSGGARLDERLQAVHLLADPKPGKRILDVGCGRGELALAMGRSGAEVVGLDYSMSAKAICDELAARFEAASLRFVCEDVMDFEEDGFDVITAADFVEHVEPRTLDAMLAKMACMLRPGGRLVVHTAPNRLTYAHDYRRKREMARQAGLYLPPNPRSFYEDLMHINEQTPAGLRHALADHFEHVCIWLPDEAGPAGTLRTGLTREALGRLPSIFAVAGHEAFDPSEILALLSQEQEPDAPHAIELDCEMSALEARCKQGLTVSVRIRSCFERRLASLPPHPIHVSYHWRSRTGEMLVQDGVRTKIFPPMTPGSEHLVDAHVITPEEPGQHILEMTMVQEGVCWFENARPDFSHSIEVDVLAPSPDLSAH